MEKIDLPKLPDSVRYVKNGERGQWWKTAKTDKQIHAGWSNIPDDLLKQHDLNLDKIKKLIEKYFADRNKKNGATQDFNALCTFLNKPSQHVWVTFEDDRMWWCTVHDGIVLNKDGESSTRGYFWLRCDRPWSDMSLNGKLLAFSTLPGNVTKTAGHQATVCEPGAWVAMLRIIRGEQDPRVVQAEAARLEYRNKILDLIQELPWRDFEHLVDLIMARTGWLRRFKLGGVREGVDIEAENVASGEIAFVQVKSSADQHTLDDYMERFSCRRDHYDRMFFAVHTLPQNAELTPKSGLPIHVWTGEKIADLVVRLGLGEWVQNRIS